MTHGRTAALAVGLLGALAAGAWGQARWPETARLLDCPAERVRWEGEGALGVGTAAAHALVQARPFRSWAEVDSVRGVGPVRLQVLQRGTELDP